MNQPLPTRLRAERPDGDYNAGLWYDKFFESWSPDFTKVADDAKLQWVHDVTGNTGNFHRLEEQQRRLRQMVAACGGRLLHCTADGPFVTGLGREHPIENGFAWHHTLGVPYLPGSSVKGMLRAWAREQNVAESDIERIFGPTGSTDAHIGSVICLDALPAKPVWLKADVMTPHYGSYYQYEDTPPPPADWHDPVPIPFLAVDAGQSFVFGLMPRRPYNNVDRADCEQVSEWLAEALRELGAGAKTAVGYGRFVVDDKATKQAAEQAREERERQRQKAVLRERIKELSPLARELEHAVVDQNLETDKNAFTRKPFIEDWLDRLEQNPAPDALQRFQGLVRRHFPGLLEDPNRTRGKKNKPVFSDRQREIAQRILHFNEDD